jgi:hypothetical protein
MVFALLVQVEQELWSKGVGGSRVLSADEVTKYKVCAPGSGLDVDFVPYSNVTGNVNDQGFVVLNKSNHAEVNYTAVGYCSNPTW